jgi:hypothetical protein
MSIIIVQNDSKSTKHASHCANSIHPADQQEFEEFRARQSVRKASNGVLTRLHFERQCFTTIMPMCCVLLCAINTLADQWRVPNSWTDEAGDLKLTLIALVMPATACKCFSQMSIMLPR